MKKKKNKTFVISKDEKTGLYYCHNINYPNIPVKGSVRSLGEAVEICEKLNNSCTLKE